MSFWNLYSRTACALFGQVLILQRLPRRTRFRSRAVIREFPRDFCSRFRDEFFDGYFETALRVFETRASSGRTGAAPAGSGQGCDQPLKRRRDDGELKKDSRAGFSCRTGFATIIDCRKDG